MIRRPPRSTQSRSSAASDVYKRQRLLQSGHRTANAGRVIRLPTVHDDGAAAVGSTRDGWAAAARAERRLQATQVGIVVVLSMVVVAVAVLTGRSMVTELAGYRSEQGVQTRLNKLRFTLQEEEAGLWQRRTHGDVS